MAKTMVNFRIDDEIKKEMEVACQEMGMNISTAFTIFATKVAREKRIPFDVCVDPFYSESNMNALKQSIHEMENGKVVVKTMQELEEMENE
ncbi:MAG: type II toxin-antitoxin system RelB/DinJ family antitoxin [Bacillota bacterium]